MRSGADAPDAAACEAALRAFEAAVTSRRYLASTERELGDAVAEAVGAAGVVALREHRLPGGGRLDFFVEPGLAVELKLGGSLAGLTRQVSRYAGHPGVGAVLVVSMRARHAALPERIAGKPLRVVTLGARGL